MTSAGDQPADPDAGQPHWNRTLYAVWAGQLLALIGFSSRVPFLPFYLGDLGVTTVEGQTLWSGAINASGAAAMALTAPLWGLRADRFGRKPMLLRGLFGGAFVVMLMGFANAPWQLVALRVAEGTLTGTVAAATALIATSAPKRRLGYALGMVQTAVFAGAACGPLLGGFAYDRIGPRPTFWLAAAMLFAGGVTVACFARERFVPMPKAMKIEAGRWQRFVASSAYLTGIAMLSMLTAIFAIRMVAMSMQPIIPLFVAQLAPDNPDVATVAGIVLGAAGLTSALAAAYLGRLGDRTGHRRVLAVSLLGAGLLYLPMALARAPWQLALLQALLGVAAGGLIPSANALVAHLTPVERRGAVFGVTAALSGLGGFIGPLLGAILATSLGFRATFLAAGAFLLVIAVMVIWSQTVAETARRPDGQTARRRERAPPTDERAKPRHRTASVRRQAGRLAVSPSGRLPNSPSRPLAVWPSGRLAVSTTATPTGTPNVAAIASRSGPMSRVAMRSRATVLGAPTMSVVPSRPMSPAGRSHVSRSARLTLPCREISARTAAQTCRLERPTSATMKRGSSGRDCCADSTRGEARRGTTGDGAAGAASRETGNPSRSQRARISRRRRGATKALPASTASQTAASSQPQPEPGSPSRSSRAAAATASQRDARSRSSLRSAGVAARSLALSKARSAATSPGASAGGRGAGPVASPRTAGAAWRMESRRLPRNSPSSS